MITRLATVILLVILATSCAYADGIFIKGQGAILDPASQAHDISEPSQKALIIHYKGMEELILQVSYKGDASDFAWLVPTPSRPEVTKVTEPVFHELHTATAPKVKYWFDADDKLQHGSRKFGIASDTLAGGPGFPPGVQVLEEKQVGAYDIAVLKATVADDLLQWLKRNRYQVTPEIGPVLGDYIKRGWVFTAMRVHTGYQSKAGQRLAEGTLQSLAFKFSSPEPVYPLTVSSLNKGSTELLLYVITNHRVEEPLLKTECCLSYENAYLELDALPRGPREPSRQHREPSLPIWDALLTKLTATLSPEQMTRDLALKPAVTDALQDPAPVNAPLIENIGASALLLSGGILAFPGSLLILGIVGLIALSPVGRKRWRVWLATGIIIAMASIFASGMLEMRGGMDGPERSAQYAAVGTGLIVILAVGVIAALVCGVRRLFR